MLEITRFRLKDGAGTSAALEANAQLQTGFAYQQPGLLRRTVASGETGWIVIDLWRSAADADACAERWPDDPIVAAFLEFVDGTSVVNERYETLGG